MHSYQHNIKTFNNATRHLTRVERALYRDLIELYYDTEQPLPAADFDRLARRVMAHSDEEKAALQFVLDEFFERTGDVYTHDYCDEQIEKFHASTTAKARAGAASAESRRKKAEERKAKRMSESEQNPTGVQRTLNTPPTSVHNQKPETINQKPILKTHTPDTPDGDPGDPPEKPKPAKYKFDSDHMDLATRMADPVRRRHPSQPIDLDQWADAIRKLIDLDGRPPAEIMPLWIWVTNHGTPKFSWAENCRTPMKLRDRDGQGMQYWDVIQGQRQRDMAQPRASPDKPGPLHNFDDVDYEFGRKPDGTF